MGEKGGGKTGRRRGGRVLGGGDVAKEGKKGRSRLRRRR